MNLNVSILLALTVYSLRCSSEYENLKFSLVRRCQRSQQKLITLENTETFEECVRVAKNVYGLAINYAPSSRNHDYIKVDEDTSMKENKDSRARNRQNVWQQPEEFFNCHILECPENSTFCTLVYDSRFDYFSLYDSHNYSCLSELGLFQLQTEPMTFLKASTFCSNLTGSLAHVASAKRTNAFSSLLNLYNERRNKHGNQRKAGIQLAYVGLHFNISKQRAVEFRNAQNESLNYFVYRAWSPGNPKLFGPFANASCVAITTHRSWISVQCERELPFICEIYSSIWNANYFDIESDLTNGCSES